MNLSQYPNLCKAEKIKSTPRILQKNLFSLFDSSIMTEIVERVYIKVKFLIASDWCSPIKRALHFPFN